MTARHGNTMSLQALYLLLKAHVKHAVSFIKHQERHSMKTQDPAIPNAVGHEKSL